MSYSSQDWPAVQPLKVKVEFQSLCVGILMHCYHYFVLTGRSLGKQHAAEATRSAELPEEGSVGVLGVHHGHHCPGNRRFQ